MTFDALEFIRGRCRMDGDCWVWTGAINNVRTPVMNRQETGFKSVRRVAWEASGRKAKPGWIFSPPDCHEFCVNPEHQNHCSRGKRMTQLAAEGKLSCGPLHSVACTPGARKKARLNWEIVRKIRADYAEHGNARQIARDYKLSNSHAHRICTHVWWRETSPWAI